MSATTRLAEFVVKTSLRDCPDAAITQVRRATLDTLGVTLAGAGEPVARVVRNVARAEGGLSACTVLGTALRTSPTWAALANGAAGHAHDFDDTSFALMGHPSVPLLSAALACAEAEMADGAAVALAYVLGFEIDAALGIALNPDHYTRGWHATSSIGTLGCAAAAARLLALDLAQTRHALGIAASLASGLKENFGSMTKPYHAGHAARNGVLAAMLAREGQTASEGALDGRQGYAAAFGGGALGDRAFDGLGQRWQLVASGIAVKPYPSCALTHATIDALLALRAQHALTPAQVAAVEVGVNHVVPDVLQHATPTTALERKFSMQFCAATALAEGQVPLGAFEDGPAPPPVRDLMGRVTMVIDPSLPDGLEQHAWTRVTVRLTDGRVLALPARGASGHPDQPLSDDQLRAKFLTCAAPVLGRDEAEGVAAQVGHLEDIPDIRALTSRLAFDRE
ncbi:MAG TPA: MmgE/PrpD family protein [Methylomirabilota bacterium]|jgi:2-methylcitrate dehydratase PrpD|nr:MmgE/PrpD family protein [Methylomirabilota bacterium]